MKTRTDCRTWAAFMALCLLVITDTARASTIDIGSGGYYDNVVATPSSPLSVWDFVASAAGTVTLSVTDPKLGDLLTALSTSVALFDGSKVALEGSGVAVFDIASNQRFTTSIYAQTAGARGWSIYNLTLSYAPKASEVPLPLGGWLLFGGCGLVATRMRRMHTSGIHATV